MIFIEEFNIPSTNKQGFEVKYSVVKTTAIGISPRKKSLFLHRDGSWKTDTKFQETNQGYFDSKEQAEEALKSLQEDNNVTL